ncbi:uncharacterized protein K02A2.6-like [Ornithodoros turicata]|uniref:uncharacterized protein K02A2.6-like n=1 Tax=Ornithodoros turicata TaxID=34597 RepID=UPI0031399A7D
MSLQLATTDVESLQQAMPTGASGDVTGQSVPTAMGCLGHIEPFDPNMSDGWECYLERINLCFETNGLSDAGRRKSVFLTLCGSETYGLVQSLLLPRKLAVCSYQEVHNALTEHFAPQPSEILRRFHFHKRDQQEGESITKYMAEIRNLSEFCNFTDLDSMLRDRLVCGIRDQAIQKRLFADSKLTLKSALEIALAAEAANKNVSEIKDAAKELHYASNQATGKVKKRHRSKEQRREPQKNGCNRCGGSHDNQSCRFKNAVCKFCRKKGHLERVCFKKQKSATGVPLPGPLNHIEDDVLDEVTSSMNHMDRQDNTGDTDPIMVKLRLDGAPLAMEVDSGAGPSALSETVYRKLWSRPPPLQTSSTVLRTWSQQQVPILGSLDVEVQYTNISTRQSVLVAPGDGPCLQGRSWFRDLGIEVQGVHAMLDKDQVWLRNPVFGGGLGKFTGPPVTIDIEKDATPVFKKCRPIPFAMRDKVSLAIQKMVTEGVLEPVAFSKCATRIVPVHKRNGTIRICGDYRCTVNTVSQPDKYPLPTSTEMFAFLANGVLFTKLDLEQAYLQLPVDEESSSLLTLNTPLGLFKVKRLPFWVSAAPGIFQRFIETVLHGVPGVAAFLDDIIITGKTVQEHDQRVQLLLERLQHTADGIRPCAEISESGPRCQGAERQERAPGFPGTC